MRHLNQKKRGFTLSELAIVLAVLAIVTTMVVSFNTLMHHRRAVSQAKLDVMNDIKLAEVLIENFLEENEIEGRNIKNGDADVADTKITASEKNLEFSGHDLTVGTSKVTLEKVTDITFVFKTENTNGKIYFCTIDYTVPGKDSTDSYTFCVTSFGNETNGGGEQ